jgi:predicted lipoprotein
MIAATSTTKSTSAGPPLASVFAKEAELWMGAQSDLLTGIEAMMTGWMRRQRQAFDASSRSMQRICGARSLFDLLQAQQEWVSECLNWTASEIRAVGNDTTAISRRAAERLGEPREQPQTKPPSETAPNIAVERAAAE